MPHSARIAWYIAALFAAVAAGLIAFPPVSFGARLDFLVYQRGGFAPGTVFRAVAGVAIAAAIFALVRQGTLPRWWRSGRARLAGAPRAYGAAMAAIFAVAFLSHLAMSALPMCLTPDSDSYFGFGSQRTVGYPAFLWALGAAATDAGMVLPAQSLLLISALATLAHGVGRLCDDRLAALCVFLFAAGNASLAGYAGYVLAETPFAALLAFHLACVAALCRRFTWQATIAAGLALGCAILVRPAGYAFLGALPGLVLLLASRRIVGTLAIAALTAIPLLGASAVNQIRFGFFATQDIGGYSLLGHTAHLIAPDMPSAFGDLPARIAQKTAPFADAIAAAGFPHGAWRTAMNAYNPQLYGTVLPEIQAWLDAQPDASRPENAAVAAGLAHAAIRHDPAGYARQVAANYYGLWLLSFLPHGPMAERLAVCSAGHPNADRLTPADLFWAVATLGQFPALGIAFVACWLAIPLWLAAAGRSAVWRFAIYAALGVNAYFIGFSTTQVALPRYAAVVEPWLIALLVVLPAVLSRAHTHDGDQASIDRAR